MFKWFRALLPLIFLTACAESLYAPDAEVEAARYVSEEAPFVALVTMLRNKNDSKGDHSALLINAGEVVLYDPAGSFKHPDVPERNDVLYGVFPSMFEAYAYYHARTTHHTLIQTLPVSMETALELRRLAEAEGASSMMMCSNHVSNVLRGAGINVDHTYYPGKLSQSFAELPGVTSRIVYDEDEGQNLVAPQTFEEARSGAY
ncbi:hypothetical protein ACMA5I_03015 [Paracoccaceae bacterium GXU_MW_L88]